MPRHKSDSEATAAPDREFLPLRTLAQVLTAFLAGDVILTVVSLIAQLVNLGEPPAQVDAELEPLVGLFHVAVFTTQVLFLIWFYRARINAERDCWQSRARPWTFWGWFVPIGNLWIPFQIMRDIWRAGLASENRTRTTSLLAWWWASYLLVKPISLAFQDGRSQRAALYGVLLVPDNWLSLTLFAIAGILLIAIIGTVSNGRVGSPNAPGHAALRQDGRWRDARHAEVSSKIQVSRRHRRPRRRWSAAFRRRPAAAPPRPDQREPISP